MPAGATSALASRRADPFSFRPSSRHRSGARGRAAAPFARRTARWKCRPSCPSAPGHASRDWRSSSFAGTGAEMVLANTYHLALRPGRRRGRGPGRAARLHGLGRADPDRLAAAFKLFSLAANVAVTERGGRLPLAHRRPAARAIAGAGRGHPGGPGQRRGDGAGPRRARCPTSRPWSATPCERTIRWAERCRRRRPARDQALFAIVQGGLDADLRRRLRRAVGGARFSRLCRGRAERRRKPAEMYRMLDATVPALPADRPRYLMGVGRPEDLLEAIRRGIDLFDCVMPTRNGRNAMAFTDAGPMRLRNLQYQRDPRPLEAGCPCPACRRSRGYMRHLFMAGEMLGPMLVVDPQPDLLPTVAAVRPGRRSRDGRFARVSPTRSWPSGWRRAASSADAGRAARRGRRLGLGRARAAWRNRPC